MAAPKGITDEQFIASWKRHGSPLLVANELGVSIRVVHDRRRRIESTHVVDLDVTNPHAVRGSDDEKLIRRLRAELESAKVRQRAAERELTESENLREAVFKLAAPLHPGVWRPVIDGKGSYEQTPILLGSDWHVGEVIRASEMDGVNAYNMDVARSRYRRLIERTIKIAKHHVGKVKFPGIVYARAGDLVGGEIHQELRETNDLMSAEAVRFLVEMEIEGIEELRRQFGRVKVVTVPGNHGRSTMKPFAKRFAFTNFDTLSGWMLESHLRGNKAYEWLTPESGDALVDVYDFKYLFTHGDRIGSRGGEGFIGPTATIARGVKRTRDYYATMGTHVDVVFLGHFHTLLSDVNYFANGCLSGVSEYSKSGRMIPARPSQWLTFTHPKHGITSQWPIYLGEHLKVGRQSFKEVA